jgi:DNA repair protein RadC
MKGEQQPIFGRADEHIFYPDAMRQAPEGEQPKERFKEVGASGLSQRELLAIVLRSGPVGVGALKLADALLNEFDGLGGLAKTNIQDLQYVHGIGEAKAIEIKAALELGRRMVLATMESRPQIKTPADAANLFMLEMGLLEQEEVRTMLLDIRYRVISIPTIYKGSLNAVSMRVAEVFKQAIRHNSASLIVAHNHPSNDPTPSVEDISVTKTLVQAGKLLEIEVLDHMVVCQNRYVSLKERGLGFG